VSNRLIRAILGISTLSSVLLAAATVAATPPASSADGVFQRYVAAIHAADMNTIRSLISADVHRSDYVKCTAAMDNVTCLTTYIEDTIVKPRAHITVLSSQVEGDQLTASVEIRSKLYQQVAAAERIVGTEKIQVKNGKILDLHFIPDFKDEATARFFQRIGVRPKTTQTQP
jgi:hypothetical protein